MIFLAGRSLNLNTAFDRDLNLHIKYVPHMRVVLRKKPPSINMKKYEVYPRQNALVVVASLLFSVQTSTLY